MNKAIASDWKHAHNSPFVNFSKNHSKPLQKPLQALNPNELGAVVRVMTLLAAEIDANGPQALSGATGDLYVVDDRSVLVSKGLTLYNDATWLRGRVDSARMRAVHPKVRTHGYIRLVNDQQRLLRLWFLL